VDSDIVRVSAHPESDGSLTDSLTDDKDNRSIVSNGAAVHVWVLNCVYILIVGQMLVLCSLSEPQCLPSRFCLHLLFIPPPTRNVEWRYSIFQQKFLYFFLLLPNVRGCSTDRQPLWLRRSDIGVILEIGSIIWWATSIKICSSSNSPTLCPNFSQFSTLPVHCSGMEQDIANLKTDY